MLFNRKRPTIRISLLLLILFVTVPILELTLLVWLSHEVSLLFTIGVILATGIAGTLLAKSQGFSTYQRIRAELSAGRMPGSAVADAAMIFAAGALLMTPGLLTDTLGFALLIPAFRNRIKQRMLRWAKERFHIQEIRPGDAPYSRTTYSSKVVDSHVVSNPPPEDRPS